MKGLKFAQTARLAEAYLADNLTATVRYEDEKNIEAGDTLELLYTNGTAFGVAEVTHAEEVEVRDALEVIEDHGAIYHIDHTEYLISRLHQHYGEPMTMTTPVKPIILDPEIFR